MHDNISLPLYEENYFPLALLYFDSFNGSLKELDDSVSIQSYPYESVIRRFYLSGSLLKDTSITVSAFLDGIQKHNYEVKVLCGQINPRLYDFENATNTANIRYNYSYNNFANAIPVDVLLTSKSETESIVLLDFKIEAFNVENVGV